MRPLPLEPKNNSNQIGAKLRAARQAHGYTLEKLAESVGLTKGFLSRIERDEASLSVSSLITLCDVMSLDVGSLFTTPDIDLVRLDDAPSIDLGGVGVVDKLMTPRGQSQLQMVHSTVDPGGNGGPTPYTINCNLEIVYCLSGAVEIDFPNCTQRLDGGDALTFAGGEPHTWSNLSPTKSAELIWILVPAPWSSQR